jgi:hypothetical protein
MVEHHEAFQDSNNLPHFLGVLWMEGHSHCGLRSHFEHVLPLFIKAGRNGIPLLERDQQGRQRRAIVVTLFDETAGWANADPGELLKPSQTLDPRTVSTGAVFAQKPAGAETPSIVVIFFQAQSDALRQSLLDFRKLVLPLVLLFVLLCVLLQPFLVLQSIVMVVDPILLNGQTVGCRVDRRTCGRCDRDL